MNALVDTVSVAALSQSETLFELGLVVVLAAAPLIGQVLRLPSILVLLALGFGAGAVGALDPNALLGQQLISAVVSVAVGIILFVAGLGLRGDRDGHRLPTVRQLSPSESGAGRGEGSDLFLECWFVAVSRQPSLSSALLAMQKVVGSNPISRFSRNPALGRDFVVHG